MLATLERIYHLLALGPLPQRHWLGRLLVEFLHVVVVLVREGRRDRLHVRAAMLSYWTAVAIVPILLLGFSLTAPLGLGDSTRDAVRRLLYDTILADSVEEVGLALDALLASANLGALGILGLAGVMLIGAQLYFNAELAYNDIFQTRVRRSFLLRITLFYAGITLAPAFLAGGFVATATLPDQVNVFRRALPVLLTMTALVGALRLLPCRDVSWRSSLLGGLFSASAFEAAKVGFGAYTRAVGAQDSLAGVWGSLAFLPAFLLWLYVLWMIVLIGVEVAWLSEHYDVLIGAQRRSVRDPHAHQRQPDGFFALAALGVVARRWLDGAGPTVADQVVAESGADPKHVQIALDTLQDAGLLVQSDGKGYLPALPPQQLTAADVLSAWRGVTSPGTDEASAFAEVQRAALRGAFSGLDTPGAWVPAPLSTVHVLSPAALPDSRGGRPRESEP